MHELDTRIRRAWQGRLKRCAWAWRALALVAWLEAHGEALAG
jgi:hypothetical protein